MALTTARSVVHGTFAAMAFAITVYVGVVAFGLLPQDVTSAAIVAVAVTVVTAILGIRVLLDRRIAGERGVWWTMKMSIAALAIALAVIGGGYEIVHMDELVVAAPFFDSTQMVMGALLLAAVVLTSWLHWGWVLPGLVVASIAYFFFGHHVENPLLSHPAYDAAFVMNFLSLNPSQGVYMFLQLLTDDLYFLILFGAILVGIGVVRLFMEVGNAVGAHVSGGAAFPAIIASSVLGSIIAQAVACTTIIGRLTIPTMKRAGYSASMAGAIETMAASSGQLMPPILAVAAFIMAALLSIPYVTIALAAFVPAMLYIISLVFSVMSYSGRVGLGKINIPVDWNAIWRLLPGFAIPFAVVIWMLMNYESPSLSGLVGIALSFIVWALNGKYRIPVKELLENVVTGFELVLALAILILLIGPLAQTFQTTGLSNSFGVYLSLLVPESKIAILIIGAIVSMILGMGLPTPIAYLAAVLTMGSFMIQVGGVDPFLAHFFILYFSTFSTITPPVAVGALAAARIAEVSYWYVGGQSMKIALSMFMLPFVFVYNPVLLQFPKLSWLLAAVTALMVLVQWCTACSQFGHMYRSLSAVERLILGVTGGAGFITLLQPDWTSRWIFAAVAVLLTVYFYLSARWRHPARARQAAAS
jgi:TRAP transporter 4TM/12TM fusion protein